MSWIKHPVILEGKKVRLVPLQKEHLPELMEAGKDPVIWEQLPVDGSKKGNMATNIKEAILKRINGEQYPFTVIDREKDIAIGSTRLLELFPEHRKLEIGWTWYAPEYWGKGYNTECKLLLLSFCFEALRVNRVQIKTRNSNVRSQEAIKKIGGMFEGILRKDRIMQNGEVRDTVVFSIIDDEWPAVKTKLEKQVEGGAY